ncbi:MAG: hypothetical protein L3K17_04510 [Thermoplasmata archaeon]|nr:hypothetical protein [Thermoplasmata archaeon]
MARHGWSLAAGLFVVGLTAVGGLGSPAFHSNPVPDHFAPPPLSPSAARLALWTPLAIPQAGGQGRLFVNTTDPGVVPNTGLRTNITAYFPLAFPSNSAFQAAVEEVIGNDTAVFGVFQNDLTYPVAFFSVFSNATDATLHLAYWSSLILSTGVSYDFALVAGTGTVWTLTVNGELFDDNASEAAFDFGATHATWGGGLGFSEVSIYAGAPSTPSEVQVPLCMAVRSSTGWYLPHSAQTYSILNGGAQWGVEGRAQDPLLAPGELVTGASISNVTNGSSLWTGGPIPVSVTLSLSATVVPSTSRVEALMSVAGPNGIPLPDVALDVQDSSDGYFSPAAVETNETGAGVSLFVAPNVTARGPDLVRATVTLFGFQGNSSASVVVLPAAQVLLSAGPNAVTLIEGSSMNVTILATDLNGSPESGLLVLFTVSGGNLQFVPYTTTGIGGTATVTLTFPASIESVLLIGEASTPGYWGHVSVRFTTVPPPPTVWDTWSPYLFVGIIVGAAALGLFLMERGRRRRLRPIPPIVLPPEPVEDVAAVSRTPP